MGSTLSDRYLLECDAEVASVAGPGERKGLPKFDYNLDESDPDVVVLRRQEARSWPPSAPRGPPVRASLRP